MLFLSFLAKIIYPYDIIYNCKKMKFLLRNVIILLVILSIVLLFVPTVRNREGLTTPESITDSTPIIDTSTADYINKCSNTSTTGKDTCINNKCIWLESEKWKSLGGTDDSGKDTDFKIPNNLDDGYIFRCIPDL